MSEFDVTLCEFYDDNFCFKEECPVIHCDGYECIFKEMHKLREHCKFIDETNKILNEEKESLLKENEELRKRLKTSCKYYAPCSECALTGKNCCGTYKCIEKYKQCLDEIEEIASKEICCVNSEISCCELCDRIEEIKQKIKEVKEK